MKYYVCTYGKSSSFDGVNEVFAESAKNNCYKIHKAAKHPSAIYDIDRGDVIFLSFNQLLVAWGVAQASVQQCKEDWHLAVNVDKWRFYNPSQYFDGVSSYGVANATVVGGSMSTVRQVKASWAVEKVQSMGYIKELPTLDAVCLELSLKDVASWQREEYNSDSGIVASIPALQRGLVWSPQQNELLWDSLFRRIPIGAIILSPMTLAQSKGAPCTHMILDGQQRCNAIALGFDKDPFATQGGDRNKSILWLDLSPANDIRSKTSRRYLFRVTTPAHPWGYEISDEMGRSSCLNAGRIRDAISRTSCDQGRRLFTSETYPYAANIPFPVGWLIDAYEKGETEADFKENVLLWSKKLPFLELRRKVVDFCETDEATLRYVYNGIDSLFQSRIVAMNSPKEIVEEEVKNGEQATIEHLFSRINRQGTRLDGEELVFSTIKTYWPEIEDVICRCAEGKMLCSRMLSLGLRFYFTDMSSNFSHWSGGVGVNRIKRMSVEERKKIKKFLEDDLGHLLDIVDRWLGFDGVCGLPKVLKTAVAQKTPEIYLLLLTIAKHNSNIKRESIVALTLLLYFFDFKKRKSRREDAIRHIVNELYEKGFDEDVLRDSVAYARTGEGDERWLVCVKNLQEYTKALKDVDFKISLLPEDSEWRETLNRVVGNKDVLLFAQREYLEVEFGDYDPARKDLWAEYNRPWDYDHIIPQSIVNKWNQNVIDNQWWLWSIGNFAAIPLEDNRSKNDKADWQYYKDRANVWPAIFDVKNLMRSYSDSNDEDGGLSFRASVWERLLHLYGDLYNLISPIL